MPKHNLTLADYLEKAQKLIATPDTWCKGKYYKDGKYCMMGALNATHGKLTKRHKHNTVRMIAIGRLNTLAEEYLCEAIKIKRKCNIIGLLSFNDDKKTRHPSVMSVFDMAIKKAKKDGF